MIDIGRVQTKVSTANKRVSIDNFPFSVCTICYALTSLHFLHFLSLSIDLFSSTILALQLLIDLKFSLAGNTVLATIRTGYAVKHPAYDII